MNDYIETQSEVYNLVDFPLTKQVLMTHRTQHMTINQTDIDPSELAYMQTIEVKTLLMLPMEFQDRVVGLVEVMDKQIERTFTLDEIALAQQLANQAASAIENARLYDQVQQELADRVRTEKALRESEARLDGIITTATDAIITIDARQRLLLFNAAAEQMFRYKAGDVIGQSLDLILPKQFRDQNGIKTHATEIQGHIMGQRAGGERFPIEARTSQ
ncbi:MAG: PAS domain S-box protein, partial [Ketobacter sp.]|nr:PAS domain S-box protein [Ketobacter sp.]